MLSDRYLVKKNGKQEVQIRVKYVPVAAKKPRGCYVRLLPGWKQ